MEKPTRQDKLAENLTQEQRRAITKFMEFYNSDPDVAMKIEHLILGVVDITADVVEGSLVLKMDDDSEVDLDAYDIDPQDPLAWMRQGPVDEA